MLLYTIVFVLVILKKRLTIIQTLAADAAALSALASALALADLRASAVFDFANGLPQPPFSL